MEWAAFQYRRARGDYTPDPSALRFPEWSTADAPEAALQKGQSGGETLTTLFDLWKTQHQRAGNAARSVDDFKHKVDSLRVYLGHDDASRVTGLAVDKWCDQLLLRLAHKHGDNQNIVAFLCLDLKSEGYAVCSWFRHLLGRVRIAKGSIN